MLTWSWFYCVTLYVTLTKIHQFACHSTQSENTSIIKWFTETVKLHPLIVLLHTSVFQPKRTMAVHGSTKTVSSYNCTMQLLHNRADCSSAAASAAKALLSVLTREFQQRCIQLLDASYLVSLTISQEVLSKTTLIKRIWRQAIHSCIIMLSLTLSWMFLQCPFTLLFNSSLQF